MSPNDLFSNPEPAPNNVPEFSVSEISHALKRSVEDRFSHVRVRGELSRVTIAKSGHLYTDLKDDQSVLNMILWKTTVSKLSFRPEEGVEVIATGRLTTYPGRSNYQLIAEDLQIAGQGAIMKMIEDRRKRLAEEGLFATERKKAIPFLPRKIGVITSPTGAVIRDILHRLEERFPVEVLLWPVMVQGQGASDQITNAINGFDALDEDHRPDVLIVARGGGSFEDLMPFQEENVVRAVANCSTPIISAVGHETDTTLIDYAADLRAPTPTGAAEKAVPVRQELLTELLNKEARLNSSLTTQITHKSQHVATIARALPHPQRLYDMQAQKLDHLDHKLSTGLKSAYQLRSQQLDSWSSRLPHPRHSMSIAQTRLSPIALRLDTSYSTFVERQDKRLEGLSQLLETLSFKSILKRGYSVIKDENGAVITHKKDLPQNFILELQDGEQAAQKQENT